MSTRSRCWRPHMLWPWMPRTCSTSLTRLDWRAWGSQGRTECGPAPPPPAARPCPAGADSIWLTAAWKSHISLTAFWFGLFLFRLFNHGVQKSPGSTVWRSSESKSCMWEALKEWWRTGCARVRMCFRGNGQGGDTPIPELARPRFGRRGGSGGFQEPWGWEALCQPQTCYPDWNFCRQNILQLQYANTTLQRKNIKAIFWRLESFQKKKKLQLSPPSCLLLSCGCVKHLVGN